MNKRLFCLLICLATAFVATNRLTGQVIGSVEDVQIRTINFETQILELHNFGSDKQSLAGWRFCSHDELDGFDYTSATGLNGMSLAPGGSLFVHWLNDATMYDQVNISTLGGNAVDDLIANTPGSAISIGIYRNGSFGNADSLVDHIQYSFNGEDVSAATPRGVTAVNAGLWTAASDWIVVDETSLRLFLNDTPFPGPSKAHGPQSYEVVEPETLEITPFFLTINSGDLGGGIVEYLSVSDDVDVSVRRSLSSLQPVVEIEVSTISPYDMDTVTALEFDYESSVFARGMVTQTISLFDYKAGSFEEVDSRTASRFVDSTATIVPSGDVSRFVEAGSMQMKAKIRYVASVARMQYAANADYAVWRVTN